MTTRTIHAADLFCGAGGTSTGLAQTCARLGLRLDLTAVNHWDVAVQTHSANHPAARHHCMDLAVADPTKLVPGGYLDVLLASPECTHHSVARGGRPCSDQSRASAWLVLKWAQELYCRTIIIENVPEFASWGPLGRNGRPLKSGRGQTFTAWLAALRSLGYRVHTQELVAADYGAPTTRRRLFVLARRDRTPLRFPAPTHAAEPARELGLDQRRPWRTAAEVIDWSLPCPSIFMSAAEAREYSRATGIQVRRPLAAKTMTRIAEGVRRFILDAARPFVVTLSTITTKARRALVVPFLARHFTGNAGSDLRSPVPTVTTVDHNALVVAFLTRHYGRGRNHSLNAPVPVLDASNRYALVQAFLMHYHGAGGHSHVSDPVPTVTTHERLGLITVYGDTYHVVDIGMRMLQPHELAAAQGFPPDYRFAGTKGEIVRQIGNAVPPPPVAALTAEVVA